MSGLGPGWSDDHCGGIVTFPREERERAITGTDLLETSRSSLLFVSS